MKKTYFLFLLPILVSCQSSGYQLFLGNMILSDAKKDFSSLSMRPVHFQLQGEGKSDYFADVYCLTTQEELTSFYNSETSITFSEKEKTKYGTLNEGEVRIYFFVPIPAGYRPKRRDNVQGKVIGNEEEILLTDNFYTYSTRPDFFYCYVDVVKEDDERENKVFSFFYTVSEEAHFAVDEVRIFVDEVDSK